MHRYAEGIWCRRICCPILCIFFKQEEDKNTNTFRDYYMDMVTSSFGDDLDRPRQVSVA